MYPLSGPLAPYGQSEANGQKALVDDLNAKGGIAGHQITLISVNTQGDPSIAASEAQQLISQGVAAVFSPGTETEAPADVPVFMKAKIPVIFYNPGDTWSDGTKWPYYFETGYTTKELSTGMVLAAKKLGVTKIGLASDSTSFGQENSKDIAAAAAANGIPVVKTVSYDPTAVALDTQMAQLRSAGADALLIGGGGGYAPAFTALKAMGWSPTIISFSSVYHLPQFGGLTGSSLAAKAYAVCDLYCLPQGQQPPAALASLFQTVIKAVGAQPDVGISSVSPEDNLQLLKYAVEKTNSLDGDAIKQAIEGIHGQSLTLPSMVRTYSSTDHNGLGNVTLGYATLASGLGPLGVPILAPGQ